MLLCLPGQTWVVTRAPSALSAEANATSAAPEAIARAHVQPDRRAAVGARAATGHAEQVVASEVRRAVERAGHRLAGRSEERGGVPAHGAEAPGVEACDVERAEAAHRGAADGHTPRVGVQPPQRGGDGLVHHVLRPAAAAAIVEEAAAAAARQQDRRGARAQPGQGGKQPAAEQAVGRAAAPVQQHQQRAAARASARHHQRLLERSAHVAAAQLDVEHAGPVRVATAVGDRRGHGEHRREGYGGGCDSGSRESGQGARGDESSIGAKSS